MSGSPFGPHPFVAPFDGYAHWRGSTVGVTGHRGVLGGLLFERLRRHGVDVAAFEGDVTDSALLQSWFESQRFDVFFHFAALVATVRVDADPVRAYETNAVGAFNVAKNILQRQPGCWLFHASSSHVYRPTKTAAPIAEDAALAPQTYYGVTKLAAERLIEPLLQRLNANYCIGRIFSFSHASQQEPYLVPTLRRRIAELENGATLNVMNPSAVRDIQDAETIVDAILHLALRRAQGIVNIGTGAGTSVREIAANLARALNKNIHIDGVDRDEPGSLIADTTRLRRLLSEPAS